MVFVRKRFACFEDNYKVEPVDNFGLGGDLQMTPNRFRSTQGHNMQQILVHSFTFFAEKKD